MRLLFVTKERNAGEPAPHEHLEPAGQSGPGPPEEGRTRPGEVRQIQGGTIRNLSQVGAEVWDWRGKALAGQENFFLKFFCSVWIRKMLIALFGHSYSRIFTDNAV